jgi:hypothetical protein
VRAKITSLKPFLVCAFACVLFVVMLSTEQRNGLPSGIGWAAFAVFVTGALWIFR